MSVQPPSETPDRLELQLRLGTEAQAAELNALRVALHACGLSTVATDVMEDELPIGGNPSDAALQHPVRLVATKPRVTGRELFLTVEGLHGFLQGARQELLPLRAEVAVEFDRFSSMTTEFLPWQPLTAGVPTVRDIQGDAPRRLVRDLSNDLVPRSAASWIYEASPAIGGRVWDAFVLTALNILPFTLVNEAWRDEGGTPNVSVKGDRTVSLHVPAVTVAGLGRHEALNDAAGWVYGKQDTDVRHTLLANELARELREGETWTGTPVERLTAALAQAKVAYGHHLRGQAKDALKSLTDLRKVVGDEVEKSASQTRELIGTLWRDFAVAVGALTVRLLALATPTASGLPSALLLAGTAVFLAYSFGISIWLNKRFYRHSKRLRADWHARLYGYLGEDEFSQLCIQPLRDVRRTYRHARTAVGIAYAVVFAVLVATAAPPILANFRAAPPPVDLAAPQGTQH